MGYSIWEIAKAFIDDHSELTADLYTQAIVVDPNNSELYSDRTQANIKSNNLTVFWDSKLGAFSSIACFSVTKLGLFCFGFWILLLLHAGFLERFWFWELIILSRFGFSSLNVQTLTNRKEEFRKLLESYKPSLVYLQGEQLENDEVGSCAWRDADLPTAECISNIFPHCLQLICQLKIHVKEREVTQKIIP
ncbi:hypothetical protein ABKV19_003942 [Rosa sericea]